MAPSYPPYMFEEMSQKWWIGEKYDGVRYCWNSDRKMAYTRTGKKLHLPVSFTRLLPSIFLDSELWFGRGGFLETLSIINGITYLLNWAMLRLVSFDIPASNSPETYEQRYAHLLNSIKHDHTLLIIVSRALYDQEKLQWHVQNIIEGGGEGVILQQQGSVYTCGRSLGLIKLKATTGDQEAIVVRVGERGSVQLKLPNGVIFTVPPENVHIPTPSRGEIVSYSYIASRSEVPKNANIYRTRTDVSWGDVVHSFFSEKQFLNEASLHMKSSKGYWTQRNIRKYMVQFAKSRNMDPRAPETWQNCHKTFKLSISGRMILKKFKNKYYYLVQTIFPETRAWFKKHNKKIFLENYARKHGFDPHTPDHWYSHFNSGIISLQRVQRWANALLQVFPNIGLEKSKLQEQNYRRTNTRIFFEKYAKENQFDPKIASNWYSQPRGNILSTTGAQEVLIPFQNRISKALVEAFPNIGLDVAMFDDQLAMWHKLENRRKFFEKFAHQNNFDPRKPDNWYIHSTKLLSAKGIIGVLSYHENNLPKALFALFPDIGLDKTEFRKSVWTNTENRRRFFEKFASVHGFDPLHPNGWYSQSYASFKAMKGARAVLSYYQNSVSQALLDLFPHINLEPSKLFMCKL
eukprot:Phypoly_transcript_04749.p1 GENE.Phypoly_transcript_04749~~Phypoly_transcript_04749.p1  ORF type:complete len:686 (+),score=82.56 Phypoly_transcript_04749:167-2059(+)